MTTHVKHTPRTHTSVKDDIWPGDTLELYGYSYKMLEDGTYECTGSVYGVTFGKEALPSADVAESKRAA